jgi:EAL domain-containing protein (putative c-di-GMP-specific phosphodiesterase class I)
MFTNHSRALVDGVEPGFAAWAAMVEAVRVRYQPIIELSGGRVDSAEVLVRRCAGQGILDGPERIVAAMTGPAESLGLTETILDRALAEISEFGLQDGGMAYAINVPLDALLHPGLLRMVDHVREQHDVPAGQIRFELTERHPVTDIAPLLAVTEMLRRAGYGLALDDVTPQMPNLAALLALPLQAVKIDRCLVTSHLQTSLDFVRDMAVAGAAAGVAVIAEGIETAAQSEVVRRLGVTHAQGFLYAQPLTAAALKDFLG